MRSAPSNARPTTGYAAGLGSIRLQARYYVRNVRLQRQATAYSIRACIPSPLPSPLDQRGNFDLGCCAPGGLMTREQWPGEGLLTLLTHNQPIRSSKTLRAGLYQQLAAFFIIIQLQSSVEKNKHIMWASLCLKNFVKTYFCLSMSVMSLVPTSKNRLLFTVVLN